jgi:hypothetical protein
MSSSNVWFLENPAPYSTMDEQAGVSVKICQVLSLEVVCRPALPNAVVESTDDPSQSIWARSWHTCRLQGNLFTAVMSGGDCTQATMGNWEVVWWPPASKGQHPRVLFTRHQAFRAIRFSIIAVPCTRCRGSDITNRHTSVAHNMSCMKIAGDPSNYNLW